jgi:hypothetical protein
MAGVRGGATKDHMPREGMLMDEKREVVMWDGRTRVVRI